MGWRDFCMLDQRKGGPNLPSAMTLGCFNFAKGIASKRHVTMMMVAF
jgi:hypothetical protein